MKMKLHKLPQKYNRICLDVLSRELLDTFNLRCDVFRLTSHSGVMHTTIDFPDDATEEEKMAVIRHFS
jgi:hypothetical protein